MELPVIRDILYAGIHAPSGENCQPWEFVVSGEGEVRLYNIPERDTSFYNVHQKGSLVAHGALLENVAIAASQYRYRVTADLFPDLSDTSIVADIHFEKTDEKPDPLFPYIFTRATNRKPYAATPLDNAERIQLLRVAEEVPGGIVKLEEQKEAITLLAHAVSANEAVMFSDKSLHHFFFHHINWNKEQEERNRTGFYLDTLELKPPQAVLFKIFRHWSVVRWLNRVGFSLMVAKENAKTYAASAAFGAVIVPTKSDEDFVLAGRITQRLWLRATQLNLSVQPVTGAMFLAYKVEADGGSNFSSPQKKTLRDAAYTIRKIFDAPQKNVAMVFRIGRGGEPSARSSRLPIESCIVYKSGNLSV